MDYQELKDLLEIWDLLEPQVQKVNKDHKETLDLTVIQEHKDQ